MSSVRLNVLRTWLRLLKTIFCCVMIMAAPVLCRAAETEELELIPMSLKVMAALALVLGVVLLCYALLRRSRWIPAGKHSAINVLEVRHLSPKKTLYLVEVKGSVLLLGGTTDRLETLGQWPADQNSFEQELKAQLKEEDA